MVVIRKKVVVGAPVERRCQPSGSAGTALKSGVRDAALHGGNFQVPASRMPARNPEICQPHVPTTSPMHPGDARARSLTWRSASWLGPKPRPQLLDPSCSGTGPGRAWDENPQRSGKDGARRAKRKCHDHAGKVISEGPAPRVRAVVVSDGVR